MIDQSTPTIETTTMKQRVSLTIPTCNVGMHNPGFDLNSQKRIYQYKDLCCYDKKMDEINEKFASTYVLEVKNIIEKYTKPLYHII